MRLSFCLSVRNAIKASFQRRPDSRATNLVLMVYIIVGAASTLDLPKLAVPLQTELLALDRWHRPIRLACILGSPALINRMFTWPHIMCHPQRPKIAIMPYNKGLLLYGNRQEADYS